MTFVAPKLAGDLRLIVEAAFGYSINDAPGTWQWTDITQYAQLNDGFPVALSAGAQDQGQDADRSQIVVTLANTDGRFTALNPASPYWPNVVRNVPLRVSITWAGAAGTYELLTGFVDGWPLRPNAGVINVTVPVTASGRLRRLRASSAPVLSALRGSVSRYAPVRSYHPLENGDRQAASSGTPDAFVGGAPTWSAPEGFPGSDTLPVFGTTSQISAQVTGAVVVGGGWQIDWYMLFPSAPAGSVTIMDIATPTGTSWLRWQVVLTSTTVTVNGIDPGGLATVWATGAATDMFGTWQHLRLQLSQPVLTLTVELDWMGVTTGTSHSASSSAGSAGVTAPTAWTIPTSPSLAGAQFGHVYVTDGPGNTAMDGAGNGWAGELAPARVTRLCAENNLPVTVTTSPDPLAQAMGPQTINTVANLLDECANVDNGLLHDAGPLGNLVYVSGTMRYNAAVAFTLDYTRHQIGDSLASTYDDSQLVTQWTISRPGGGSDMYTDPTADDDYARSDTVNAAADSQCANIAGWRVHLGTVDAYRIPSISIDIRGRNPELAQAVTSLSLPAHISPINLPSPYPPQSFDQFIEGWTATVDSVTWQMTFNCSPYAPWLVAVVDDATTGLVASGGSALTAPVTAAATALTVVSQTPWTQAGGDMPFDINLDGERCTVSAIAASATPMSRVGAFISSSALGASDFSTAYTNWQAITGITLPVTRWYQAQGDFGIGASNLAQMVSAGVKVCLTLRPDYATLNPAHLAAIDTMLATLKASGANLNITLWHEPFFSGLTAAQFVAVVRYYGPTVRKYYPLWFVCSGADANLANGYYPGDGYVDGVAVDAYAASGTAQITQAQAIADAGHKPLGVWEFNGGADLGSPVPVQGQTQAAITAHFQFLQDLFTARLAAGKPNGDLLLFSSGGSNGSSNFLGTSLSANGGFETGLGNWVSGSATIAQTAVQAHTGSKSAQMTSAGGTANILMCSTPNVTTQGMPCTAGQIVAWMGWFRAQATARSCRVDCAFFDSSGAALSTTTGTAATDSTSAWTPTPISSVTAPASTAFARLVPSVLATVAAEVHYFDTPKIAVLPATNDLTSPIQDPFDYRIALLSGMKTALDSTSFGQQMTVTRAVNRVAKAHNAGAPVDVWTPAIVAQ